MKNIADLQFLVGTTDENEKVYGDFQKTGSFISSGQVGSGHASFDEGAFVTNFLQNYTPDELQFVMIDPKQVQLIPYENIPHLLLPVVYTPDSAASAIREIMKLVKVRHQLFDSLGVNTLAEYNASLTDSDNPLHRLLPRIVCLCTEIADLMMIDREYYENAFVSIAQSASKVGIHLYLATQRPSADVMSDELLEVIEGRLVFATSSEIDSKRLLGEAGAETITEQGRLIFVDGASGTKKGVKASYISDEEVMRIVEQTKEIYQVNKT